MEVNKEQVMELCRLTAESSLAYADLGNAISFLKYFKANKMPDIESFYGRVDTQILILEEMQKNIDDMLHENEILKELGIELWGAPMAPPTAPQFNWTIAPTGDTPPFNIDDMFVRIEEARGG